MNRKEQIIEVLIEERQKYFESVYAWRERVATRIMEQQPEVSDDYIGGVYEVCELHDVLIGQPLLTAQQGVRTSEFYATFPNDYEGEYIYLKQSHHPQISEERYEAAKSTLKSYYKDPAIFKALRIAAGLELTKPEKL